jgi:hypothetical protein
MKSLKSLKGGIETRKGSAEYNKRFERIRKKCGCTFGEKCGKMCKGIKEDGE